MILHSIKQEEENIGEIALPQMKQMVRNAHVCAHIRSDILIYRRNMRVVQCACIWHNCEFSNFISGTTLVGNIISSGH